MAINKVDFGGRSLSGLVLDANAANTKIQVRRLTSASFFSQNPILAAGEPGLEIDTGKIKYGNGTSAWNDLPYSGGGASSGGVSSVAGRTGDIVLSSGDITDFNTAASAAAPVQSVAGRTGSVVLSNTDISGFNTAASAAAPVQSVNGQTGNVTVNVPVQSVAGRTGNVTLNVADVTGAAAPPTYSTWTQGTLPVSANWSPIIYANGLFVAVTTNAAITSPDGITWTQRTLPTGTWTNVVYANNKFIAVENNANSIWATSTDGITWTSAAIPFTGSGIILYGAGTFILPWGYGGNLTWVSADGVAWTMGSLAVNVQTGGSSRFVNNRFFLFATLYPASTSLDGSNWTNLSLTGMSAVAYGANVYVMVGSGYYNAVLTSPDGITWTSRAVPQPGGQNISFNSVEYGNGTFVAIASSLNYFITSTDGINWTLRNLPANANATSIAYNKGRFVGIKSGSNSFVTSVETLASITDVPNSADIASIALAVAPVQSVNGRTGAVTITGADALPTYTTWTQTTLQAGVSWAFAAYGNGTYVVFGGFYNGVGGNSNYIVTSPAGITWTLRGLPVSAPWIGLAYGNGVFVALSSNGGMASQLLTSPDGVTWTQRSILSNAWSLLFYGNGLFVISANSGSLWTSTDGISWTVRSNPSGDTFYGGTYGNGVFVMVGRWAGTVAVTSPDGITWTQRTLPVSTGWTGIAYGNNTFVAYAAGTTNAATSPNGITWTQRTLPFAANYLAYGNGVFIFSNDNKTIAISYDGAIWTTKTTNAPVGNSLFANDVFVAASEVVNGVPRAAYSKETLGLLARQSSVGNITNAGAIGSTSGQVVVTTTSGVLTTAATVTSSQLPAATVSALGAVIVGTGLGVSSGTVSVSYGTTGTTACVGNDSRLSDARTPLSHTHGNITNAGAIGSTSGQVVVTTNSGVLTTAATVTSSQLPAATVSALGGVIVGSGLSVSSGTVSANVTSVAGRTGAVTLSSSDVSGLGSLATQSAVGNITSVGAIGSTSGQVVVTTASGVLTTSSMLTTANVATIPAYSIWTQRTLPSGGWYSVTYGNGTFAAVANGSSIAATSSDGITWTQRTLPANTSWQSVTYGNGTFAAVATSSSITATSSDGKIGRAHV